MCKRCVFRYQALLFGTRLQVATKQKFDVSHPPQFPTIPLTNVVIDNLHLFLWVADVLINLFRWLRRQDAIAKVIKFSYLIL